MRKAKHTPGPWRLFLPGDPVIVHDHTSDRIATVAVWSQRSNLERRDAETMAADARLIATAPELLEALRPFAEQEIGGSCCDGLMPPEICGRCSKILAARAAIAKVEGADHE